MHSIHTIHANHATKQTNTATIKWQSIPTSPDVPVQPALLSLSMYWWSHFVLTKKRRTNTALEIISFAADKHQSFFPGQPVGPQKQICQPADSGELDDIENIQCREEEGGIGLYILDYRGQLVLPVLKSMLAWWWWENDRYDQFFRCGELNDLGLLSDKMSWYKEVGRHWYDEESIDIV